MTTNHILRSCVISLVSTALLGACDDEKPSPKSERSPRPPSTVNVATPPAPPDCPALASEVCTAYAGCAAGALEIAYGDIDVCTGQLSAACAAFAKRGQYINVKACRDGLAAPHCAAFRGVAIPVECRLPPGPRSAGAACGAHDECQSLFCDVKDSCGQCVQKSSLGQACQGQESCELGLVCTSDGCVAPASPGDACSLDRLCGGNLRCIDDKCAEPLREGDACAPGECDPAAGLGCDASTSRCTRVTQPIQTCEAASSCPNSARLGDACAADTECKTLGYCVDGLCSPFLPASGC
jgi:hypothetical protein